MDAFIKMRKKSLRFDQVYEWLDEYIMNKNNQIREPLKFVDYYWFFYIEIKLIAYLYISHFIKIFEDQIFCVRLGICDRSTY